MSDEITDLTELTVGENIIITRGADTVGEYEIMDMGDSSWSNTFTADVQDADGEFLRLKNSPATSLSSAGIKAVGPGCVTVRRA